MWEGVRKILVGLGWAIALTLLLGLIAASTLLSMMLYYDMSIPDSVIYYYWLVTTALYLVFFPAAAITFFLLELYGKLPRFHIRESAIKKYPAFLLSFRRIASALLWWLLVGIVPFLAAVAFFVESPKFIMYAPGLGLYLELSLLYMLYRSTLVRKQQVLIQE